MWRWVPIVLLLTWASPGLGQAPDTGTGTGTGKGGVAPKVGVVVAGDPDETLRNTASFIESEAVSSGLRVPTDPALRGAMRGKPVTEEDGLEGMRSIRRGLGLSPRKDLASYKRIGIIAGADALIVVHREGDILIEVFDVSAAQFYEGVLHFDDSTSVERDDVHREPRGAGAAALVRAATSAPGRSIEKSERARSSRPMNPGQNAGSRRRGRIWWRGRSSRQV